MCVCLSVCVSVYVWLCVCEVHTDVLSDNKAINRDGGVFKGPSIKVCV